MSYDKYNINWTAVEKALGERSESGHKIAVIETRKIFFEVLKKKLAAVPKEKNIAKIEVFKNAERLNHALIMTRKIYDEPGFELNRQEIREIIAAYYDAIKRLTALPSVPPGGFSQIFFRLKQLLPLRALTGILIGIFVLAGIIIFLNRTETGAKTANIAIAAAEFLIFRVLTVVVIIVLLAAIWKFRTRNNREYTN